MGWRNYIKNPRNWIDQAHIWVGIANALVQRFQADILSLENMLLMVITALLVLIKTLFYMKTMKELSFLVTMLQQVLIDLIPFFIFYILLLVSYGLMIGVIDWGQYEFSDSKTTRNV